MASGTSSLSDAGVLANRVECPAVSRNSARFRLQALSSHTPADGANAAAILTDAVYRAGERRAGRGAV